MPLTVRLNEAKGVSRKVKVKFHSLVYIFSYETTAKEANVRFFFDFFFKCDNVICKHVVECKFSSKWISLFPLLLTLTCLLCIMHYSVSRNVNKQTKLMLMLDFTVTVLFFINVYY